MWLCEAMISCASTLGLGVGFVCKLMSLLVISYLAFPFSPCADSHTKCAYIPAVHSYP